MSSPLDVTPVPHLIRREIVSYSRRDGRLSRVHQKAWDEHHGRYVVIPERDERRTSIAAHWRFDPVAVFGRQAPLVVEIGSGGGDTILAAASAHPGTDHLAIDVYRPGVAQTIVAAARAGLDNIRILEGDAAQVVATALPSAAIDELWVFFPDPWPKPRHHKRRLVASPFLASAARVLRSGGLLRLATDWEDYAVAMVHAAAACPEWENVGGTEGYGPRFPGRPVTRYERKGLTAGRTVRDLTLVRRSDG